MLELQQNYMASPFQEEYIPVQMQNLENPEVQVQNLDAYKTFGKDLEKLKVTE